jgi:hypothetical protein
MSSETKTNTIVAIVGLAIGVILVHLCNILGITLYI